MMSITATVENNVIVLPMEVPDGTQVEVTLPEEAEVEPTLLEVFKDFVGCIKDAPSDLATEHDHYAHGAPKRGER